MKRLQEGWPPLSRNMRPPETMEAGRTMKRRLVDRIRVRIEERHAALPVVLPAGNLQNLVVHVRCGDPSGRFWPRAGSNSRSRKPPPERPSQGRRLLVSPQDGSGPVAVPACDRCPRIPPHAERSSQPLSFRFPFSLSRRTNGRRGHGFVDPTKTPRNRSAVVLC